ncbi:MAG: hypothetical protein ABIP80_02650, partial [Ferruginibacter sp.]
IAGLATASGALLSFAVGQNLEAIQEQPIRFARIFGIGFVVGWMFWLPTFYTGILQSFRPIGPVSRWRTAISTWPVFPFAMVLWYVMASLGSYRADDPEGRALAIVGAAFCGDLLLFGVGLVTSRGAPILLIAFVRGAFIIAAFPTSGEGFETSAFTSFVWFYPGFIVTLLGATLCWQLGLRPTDRLSEITELMHDFHAKDLSIPETRRRFDDYCTHIVASNRKPETREGATP